jgi:hypothetical protein
MERPLPGGFEIAALLFANQAHAEDVILNCRADIKMWWERDKDGEMRKMRLSNYLVKIDTTTRTVGYGGKRYPISILEEGFMKVATDDGPRRVIIDINRLTGEVQHNIFENGALMHSTELTCERARPKF